MITSSNQYPVTCSIHAVKILKDRNYISQARTILCSPISFRTKFHSGIDGISSLKVNYYVTKMVQIFNLLESEQTERLKCMGCNRAAHFRFLNHDRTSHCMRIISHTCTRMNVFY